MVSYTKSWLTDCEACCFTIQELPENGPSQSIEEEGSSEEKNGDCFFCLFVH